MSLIIHETRTYTVSTYVILGSLIRSTEPVGPAHTFLNRKTGSRSINGKMACIATSTVTITMPEVERLFLDEKFAIGQIMFRKMQTPPKSALLECGSKFEAGKRVLWRRYMPSTDGFLCDIVEVFPDRDMFVQGEHR